MEKIFTICFLFLTVNLFNTQSFTEVKGIAQRQFPWIADKIIINPIEKEKGKEVFTLETKNNRLFIEASSPSSANKGLDWYIKNYCHQSISHLGSNVHTISKLPEIKSKIKRTSFVSYRYALNYCTINYSYSFYTWKDWEKELDWMALSGVNLMLAPVGTELIWYNTLLQLGYTEKECKAFISGPAFTAWWLMGNLEGWGGPVSEQLIKQQAELQKKILARMKELGIEPVLQGFYGMVPRSLKDKMKVSVVEQGKWAGDFERPDILDSSSDEFLKISEIYYSEMKKIYGSDIHFFGGEPFHEGGNIGTLNISKVAEDIQKAMQKNYPNSTWVLQGWQNNPSDQLLKGLKKENTLIIELFGENTRNWEERKGYNKTNFIWTNVSNFGEKNGLYGRLQRFMDEIFRVKESEYRESLKGVGIIPEGINNNPVAYDLVLDISWYENKPSLDQWIEKYSVYRYGKYNKKLVEAWKGLTNTVYSSPDIFQEGPSESIFCARPSLKIESVSSWGTRKRNYDVNRFKEAVALFVEAEDEFKDSETYQADKVDFLRQVMANNADIAYIQLIRSIESGDKKAIKASGDYFLTMLLQQDELLSTNYFFTLNRWLMQAKYFSKGLPDADNNLYNAKAQITFWGPDQNSKTNLRDYAHKEWGGLLSSLYYNRWKYFIENILKGNTVTPEEFYSMEVEWAKQKDLYYPIVVDKKKLKEIQKAILK